MCRWDGKKSTREVIDPEFGSRPTIFIKNTCLRHRLFYPVFMTGMVSVSGYRFKNRYLSPFLTGAFGPFSSSVAKGTPTHFFSILSDTLASFSSGHLPVFIAKYILRYSNFLFGDVEAKRFQLISTTNLFGDIETMGSCDNSVSTIIIRECTSYHFPNWNIPYDIKNNEISVQWQHKNHALLTNWGR